MVRELTERFASPDFRRKESGTHVMSKGRAILVANKSVVVSTHHTHLPSVHILTSGPATLVNKRVVSLDDLLKVLFTAMFRGPSVSRSECILKGRVMRSDTALKPCEDNKGTRKMKVREKWDADGISQGIIVIGSHGNILL